MQILLDKSLQSISREQLESQFCKSISAENIPILKMDKAKVNILVLDNGIVAWDYQENAPPHFFDIHPEELPEKIMEGAVEFEGIGSMAWDEEGEEILSGPVGREGTQGLAPYEAVGIDVSRYEVLVELRRDDHPELPHGCYEICKVPLSTAIEAAQGQEKARAVLDKGAEKARILFDELR